MWGKQNQGDRGTAREHGEKVGRGLREKPFLMGQQATVGHRLQLPVRKSQKPLRAVGKHGCRRVSSPKFHNDGRAPECRRSRGPGTKMKLICEKSNMPL